MQITGINYRDQLKKYWYFQGCSQKTHVVEGPWVLVFELENSTKGCHTILQNLQGESLFSKGKVTNLKVPGFSSEIPPPPLFRVFFGITYAYKRR